MFLNPAIASMDYTPGFILVFIGGGAGSVCRFFVEKFVTKHLESEFPFATLLVNITGSFLIGVLFVSLEKSSLPENNRLLLGTGFLGGFTTFSTLILDTVRMSRNSEYLHSLANIFLSIALGLLFFFLGMLLTDLLIKR
jgi:CrcB protein